MKNIFKFEKFKLANLAVPAGIAFGISTSTLVGCFGPDPNSSSLTASSGVSTTASATPTTTSIPSGPKMAKFLFVKSNGGSFDAPLAGGTPPIVGSGLKAARVFNGDGSLLSNDNSTNSKTWPKWIPTLEIGISGTNNTAAKNPNCAKFAGDTEGTDLNCDFGGGPATATCGAPAAQFRVSEVDCSAGSPAAANGNGGPGDGVFIRAIFDRSTSHLGASENILVVLEYSASTLNPAPANPTACLSGGIFSAESCSDFVWRTYLKHSPSDVVQPYLMLIPPTFSSVLLNNTTPPTPSAQGTGIGAKQFFLPLAADSALTTLQISRTQSNFPDLNILKSICAPNGNLPGNSPFCAGVIFYSITFYRI